MKKTKYFLAALLVLTIPTYWRMIRGGIFSTQDPHLFRFIEFDKCVRDLQIPCRWAPDSGFGFGEPLFNFYGQLSYAIGEIFHLAGFQLIDSLKMLFVLSLVGSGISMFFLSRKIWKSNLAGLVSGILYIYAPYRAVDVWVRGALPEALSFVLFPLILLKIEDVFEKGKTKDFLWLSFFVSLLILTHNLSFVMFLPVILIWVTNRFLLIRNRSIMTKLFLSFIFSLAISSFYILPVLFESKFINLKSTTFGYFDFRGHFDTLYQILFSRYWGYGASLFGPEDGLNLSVGLFQWLIPTFVLMIVIFRKSLTKNKNFLVWFFLGWLMLFLTHNKSTIIWENFTPLAYIQFPWRFLSVAVFCFALASGIIVELFNNHKSLVAILVCGMVILNTFSFFREDIWYKTTDKELLSSSWWNIQKTTSVGDYWPNFGANIPVSLAPDQFEGQKLIAKTTKSSAYEVLDAEGRISFPIIFFPGWHAKLDQTVLNTYPNEKGLVTIDVNKKNTEVDLSFENTQIRSIGNSISVISTVLLFVGLVKFRKYEKQK
ncbi:hypothetical protein A3D00_02190 [Candidatus Woesebacteria bacterium RIFCSPHIGHO2_02_FULL_38_9]|nr:MAG: hypothetical protein A3D00_02190 [Candidatus Woesebacteria bacterium RIFCSPHIGHO2_02_FULL_38_9]OGM57811.1 MAG: hypothetical protein A3A50_02245 [Candidatus Woesebacteria bacterium RIFCSPLOWO2_01_FULL_38_20]